MKHLKQKNAKQIIFLCISFFALLASYSFNTWGSVDSNLFIFYERQPEALVVGRLILSQHEGVFSQGGLNGLSYTNYYSEQEKKNIQIVSEEYSKNSSQQHDIYIDNKPIGEKYVAYKSQSGGQGIVFSLIQSISPLSNMNNLKLFRLLNAIFLSFCFSFFLSWICRHFNLLVAAITFILILFSSWLTLYGHSLWWVAWNFYLPFLTMLFVLEKQKTSPSRMSDTKIYVFIFIAVFVKCFFSGFEFITTTLVSIICPIVYYYTLQNRNFWDFIRFTFKVGVVSILAVLAEMSILILQIASLTGKLGDGVDHMLSSFIRRSGQDSEEIGSHGEVIFNYFLGDIFARNLVGKTEGLFYFGFLVLIILFFALVVYVLNRKYTGETERKNTALLYTTLFSFLAPLSWFIIFKEHAYRHSHIDFFVWYLPTFLLGFIVIGQGLSMSVNQLCEGRRFRNK